MNSTLSEFSLKTKFKNLIKATLIKDDMNEQQMQQGMMLKKEHNESAKRPDFFQNNNAIKKISKAYATIRIKSRNFLTIMSYVRIKKESFYNENFIFDIYTLLVKSLNPFLLDRKLNDHNKHELIYMLWKECMPVEFYKFVCLEKNFLYLKNVLF